MEDFFIQDIIFKGKVLYEADKLEAKEAIKHCRLIRETKRPSVWFADKLK